jgi:hypothetical protein
MQGLFMNIHKQIFVLVGMILGLFVLQGCIGEDTNEGTVADENTFKLCTDGIDNDKDGLYDCYDPGCRYEDSILVAKGEPGFCNDENIPRYSYQRSSSQATSSSVSSDSNSSSVDGSSSSEVGLPQAYPLDFNGVSLPAQKIMGLAYDSAQGIVGAVGIPDDQMGVQYYRITASTGEVLDTKLQLETELTNYDTLLLPKRGAWEGGTVVNGALFAQNGVNAGKFIAYGYSVFGGNDYASMYLFESNPDAMLLGGTRSIGSGGLRLSGLAIATDGKIFAGINQTAASYLYFSNDTGYTANSVTNLGAASQYVDVVAGINGGAVGVGYKINSSKKYEVRIAFEDGLSTRWVMTDFGGSQGGLAGDENDDERPWSVIQDGTTGYAVAFTVDNAPGILRIDEEGNEVAAVNGSFLVDVGTKVLLVQGADNSYVLYYTSGGEATALPVPTFSTAGIINNSNAIPINSGVATDAILLENGDVLFSGYNSAGAGWIRRESIF